MIYPVEEALDLAISAQLPHDATLVRRRLATLSKWGSGSRPLGCEELLEKSILVVSGTER